LELIPLDLKGLEEYLTSPLFETGQAIAISTHRAKSQMANPRLRKNDILLILAVEENELVGYAGTLPDDIVSEKVTQHFAWYSCFWVRKDWRGKGLGKQLLEKALEVWEGKLILTDFEPSTKSFYQRTGNFDLVHVQQGYRWYFRSDLPTWLPPKSTFLAQLKPLLNILDWFANLMLNLILNLKKPIEIGKSRHYLLESDQAFLLKNTTENPIKRSFEDWNWIAQNPWILPGDIDKNDKRYYFTSKAKIFKNELIEINKGKSKALIMLCLRNRILKMPYAVYEPGTEDAISSAIRQYCLQNQVAAFVSAQPNLAVHLKKNGLGALFAKPFKKQWIVSNELSPFITGFLADGDGDAAFT